MANTADELEQKGEGVLGHGVIAIMFGVADADLQLARLIEIDVAGDAGTAEHDALDVPLLADGVQQIIRNVVAAHQQGVGILQTLGYGRLVGREFLEHTHAGNVVERGELGLDGLDHRVEYGRHHDEGQIGAFALGFVNLGHGLHIRRAAGDWNGTHRTAHRSARRPTHRPTHRPQARKSRKPLEISGSGSTRGVRGIRTLEPFTRLTP